MQSLSLMLFLPCFNGLQEPIYAPHWYHFSFPLILLFLLHSLTHHGFTLLCDGAHCQLVSPTCRRGSLVQASAGCEIGRLTFVHELCVAPLSAQTHTHPHAQICCHDLKLTFMVWPPCVVGARGKGAIQMIPLAWTGY